MPSTDANTSRPECSSAAFAPLLLRVLLGALFIAHLYWKFFVLPGGIGAWWAGLLEKGYPPYVPFYVLSAEIAGALLLTFGVFTRYVALYAMPMMLAVVQFWLSRKGFFFVNGGAELPLVWFVLLGFQVLLGDGPYALVRSPDIRKIFAGKTSRRVRLGEQ